jgi:hypothetical protein
MRAGFATIDITPPVGIPLHGYHRPGPSTDILDRLFATALVIEHQGTTAVLLSIEHIGMLVAHAERLRADIAQDLDIPPTAVMLTFTHTHSGPDDTSSELARAYQQVLAANLRYVVRKAYERMEWAAVQWGLTRVDIGINRREIGPEGLAVIGHNPDAPVDRRLALMRLVGRETDEVLGLMVHCTAHGNVLRGDNNLISGDFPGWVRRRLSEEMGCPVMVVIGAAGDVNPRWRSSLDDLERTAAAVSLAVHAFPDERYITGPERLSIEVERIQTRMIELPPPEVAQELARTASQAWDVPSAAWLEKVQTLYQQGKRELPLAFDLQVLRLGAGVMGGVPLEPFSAAALAVQAKLGELAFLNGYTNGLIGYLPTAEQYQYGGYEVEWMPVVYGPATGLLMPAHQSTAGQVIEALVRRVMG